MNWEAAERFRRELNISQYSEVSALEEIGGGINEAIYEYLSTLSSEFNNCGLRKPNKIRKGEERHRSCI